jgi:hypothetical protein
MVRRIVQTIWGTFSVVVMRTGVFALVVLPLMYLANPTPPHLGRCFRPAPAVGLKTTLNASSETAVSRAACIPYRTNDMHIHRRQKSSGDDNDLCDLTDSDDADVLTEDEQGGGSQKALRTNSIDLTGHLSPALRARYFPIDGMLVAIALPLERGPPAFRCATLRSVVVRRSFHKAFSQRLERL